MNRPWFISKRMKWPWLLQKCGPMKTKRRITDHRPKKEKTTLIEVVTSLSSLWLKKIIRHESWSLYFISDLDLKTKIDPILSWKWVVLNHCPLVNLHGDCIYCLSRDPHGRVTYKIEKSWGFEVCIMQVRTLAQLI